MKTLTLSARASSLKPSPTLSITAKAKTMKSQGLDVIAFAAGEPDFNTPAPICEAAIQAIRDGFTKYTPSAGIPELREAISTKLWRENQVKASPGDIVVSCGAKHSIYNLCQVLFEAGDEVIVIAPYWMTYIDQIELAGAKPVVVHASPANDFVPDVDDIRAAITSRTKGIIVNSPCNPTGAVFDRQTVKEIAALALRHDFLIISDEIYERLVYGVTAQSFAALSSDVAERTITVGGVSKTYAMTGWRIGFAAAPSYIAKALSNFQDQVTSNPTSFAQKGAVVAFNLPADGVEAMRAEFEARRDLIVAGLRSIPGVQIATPKGAFYAFADFSAYLGGKVETDVDLASYLLDEVYIATTPGSVFGGPGRLRLSYATSRSDIERGIERIASAVQKIG